jgi:hypothetical protein
MSLIQPFNKEIGAWHGECEQFVQEFAMDSEECNAGLRSCLHKKKNE